MTDRIPTAGSYRGVGIHAGQPAERVEIVQRAIDAVYELEAAVALADYAAEPANPPEARLFAAARVEAVWAFAAEGRAIRPLVSMTRVRASVAGLDSVTWQDPDCYGTLLEPSRDSPQREADE